MLTMMKHDAASKQQTDKQAHIRMYIRTYEVINNLPCHNSAYDNMLNKTHSHRIVQILISFNKPQIFLLFRKKYIFIVHTVYRYTC